MQLIDTPVISDHTNDTQACMIPRHSDHNSDACDGPVGSTTSERVTGGQVKRQREQACAQRVRLTVVTGFRGRLCCLRAEVSLKVTQSWVG